MTKTTNKTIKIGDEEFELVHAGYHNYESCYYLKPIEKPLTEESSTTEEIRKKDQQLIHSIMTNNHSFLHPKLSEPKFKVGDFWKDDSGCIVKLTCEDPDYPNRWWCTIRKNTGEISEFNLIEECFLKEKLPIIDWPSEKTKGMCPKCNKVCLYDCKGMKEYQPHTENSLEPKVGEVWEDSEGDRVLIHHENHLIYSHLTQPINRNLCSCKLIRKSPNQSLDDFPLIPNPKYKPNKEGEK